jgi:hypothetical protein
LPFISCRFFLISYPDGKNLQQTRENRHTADGTRGMMAPLLLPVLVTFVPNGARLPVATPLVRSRISTPTAGLVSSVGQAVFSQHVGLGAVAQLPLLYNSLLLAHPVATRIATAGMLALAGDALAQGRERRRAYNLKRATSCASRRVSNGGSRLLMLT